MPRTLLALALLAPSDPRLPGDGPAPDIDRAIADGVRILVGCQEEGGAWPYQGVYGGKDAKGDYLPPVGYQIGGTAISALALLHAADPKDEAAQRAIDAGVDFVLKTLAHPLMTPEFAGGYDVRIWGHAYALHLLARCKALDRGGPRSEAIDLRIPWLVAAIEKTEIPAAVVEKRELAAGGWNYARGRGWATWSPPSTFTTAPVVQALLEARKVGAQVSPGVLDRARRVLEEARTSEGAFVYSGAVGGRGGQDVRAKVPGAIARMPVCETTLRLLGGGSVAATRKSVEAFLEEWQALEDRRKKTGTHEGPYGIAPYYYFYGHYYAAQAIESLPAVERPPLRARLHEKIFKVRDPDGSWNDRVFERSRNFGTAMVVLALLAPRLPEPAALEPAKPEGK
ncbi:MAG: hypothetical protein L0323_11175 [Planctomycetes bacterium]|nr:hypothetical protein [Planctomycetota bacterium]